MPGLSMEVRKEHLISITEGTACTPQNMKGEKKEGGESPQNVSRDKIQ